MYRDEVNKMELLKHKIMAREALEIINNEQSCSCQGD